MSSVLFFASTDAEKLRDFQPIKWGWLKFLSGLIVMLGSMANVVSLALDPYVQHAALKTIVLFSVHCLVGAIIAYMLLVMRGEWIKSYFARNVRGYLVRVLATANPKLPRWYAEVVTSHSAPTSTPSFTHNGVLMVELRLGGWVSFGGTGIFESGKPIGPNHRLRNWCVLLHKILHTGAVLVRVKYNHPDADGKHETVVLEVADAIQLLVLASQLGSNVVSISDALIEYRRRWQYAESEVERQATLDKQGQAALTQAQDALERLAGERDAARSAAELNNIEVKRLAADVEELTGKLEHEHDWRLAITYELEKISKGFDDTQRLNNSIEALEIWMLVLHPIVLIHDRDKSDQLEFWRGKLAIVGNKLFQARKRNDQKRGRAKQSAV